MATKRRGGGHVPALGGEADLTEEQSELFHDAQSWLKGKRSGLGANKFIALASPTPTIDGITCVVEGVVHADEALVGLFGRFVKGCSSITSTHDDVTGTHEYRVNLVYPPRRTVFSSGISGCCAVHQCRWGLTHGVFLQDLGAPKVSWMNQRSSLRPWSSWASRPSLQPPLHHG